MICFPLSSHFEPALDSATKLQGEIMKVLETQELHHVNGGTILPTYLSPGGPDYIPIDEERIARLLKALMEVRTNTEAFR